MIHRLQATKQGQGSTHAITQRKRKRGSVEGVYFVQLLGKNCMQCGVHLACTPAKQDAWVPALAVRSSGCDYLALLLWLTCQVVWGIILRVDELP